MNIYQKINEVRKLVPYIKKDTTVNKQYKAVTHDAVNDLIRDALIDQGIIAEPHLLKGESMPTGKQTRAGTPIIRYEADYAIHFVDMDKPTERAIVEVSAHADDEGDKAPGKALSYAVKSAELKLFSIRTGENDEKRVEAKPADAEVSEAAKEWADKTKVALLNGDFMEVGRMIHKHPDLYEVANKGTPPKGFFTSDNKTALGEMNSQYRETLKEWARVVGECVQQDDEHGVREIVDDMDKRDRKLFFYDLNNASKDYVKNLKEVA